MQTWGNALIPVLFEHLLGFLEALAHEGGFVVLRGAALGAGLDGALEYLALDDRLFWVFEEDGVVELVPMAFLPNLHQLLDLGVLSLGVVTLFEVLPEKLGDELPEVRRKSAAVFLYYIIRRNPAFAVHQAHQDYALRDGHVLYVPGENVEEFEHHVVRVGVAFALLADVRCDHAVHLGHHLLAHEGIGIDFVEIIYEFVLLPPVAFLQTRPFREHPYRVQGVHESGVSVLFDEVVHGISRVAFFLLGEPSRAHQDGERNQQCFLHVAKIAKKIFSRFVTR